MKAYTKDVVKTIKKGIKRFMALALIAALGVCMMCGLTAACGDLRYSADTFFDEQNLFDIMVVSTMGLTKADEKTLANIEGVEDVEGIYSETVYTMVNGQTKQAEVNVLSQKEINEPYVLEGSLPLRADEIVVTQKYIFDTGKQIGDTIVIEEDLDGAEDSDGDNESAEDDKKDNKFELDLEKTYDEKEGLSDKDYEVDVEEDVEEPNFLEDTYTIVGIIIDVEDINSHEGAVAFRANSSTDYRFFVHPDAVSSDVFTTIYLTLEGADEFACYSDEYEDYVDKFVTILEEEIKNDREQARYDEVTGDAYEKVDDAEEEVYDKLTEAEQEILDAKIELENGWSEYLDGVEELEKGELELEKAKRELEKGQRELEKGERKLESAERQLSDGWTELEAGEVLIETSERSLKESEDSLDEMEKTIDETEAAIPEQFGPSRKQLESDIAATTQDIEKTKNSIVTLEEEIFSVRRQISTLEPKEADGTITTDETAMLLELRTDLSEKETDLELRNQELQTLNEQLNTYNASLEELEQQEADAYADVAESRAELAARRAELDANRAEVEASKAELADGRKELEKAQAEFEQAEDDLAAAWDELEDGWAQFEDAYEELEEGREKLEEGLAEFEDGKKQYEEGVSEFEDKRQEALEKMEEARQEIADLKMASWYISTRTALSGYSNIKTDAECIESIGKAFPILFMVVAILISLTTISRMVEEDRGLIGTYKALGFTDKEIRRKYVVYALSACILGGILGDLLGFIVLPKIIFTVFDVMYQLPAYDFYFNWLYGIGSILLFIVGIVGAAIVSCSSELSHSPATLMRPKAPMNGSRVLLERVTPIWSRLSFLNKVTARNLFRYKKRLFMTLFGIAGCTSILLAGFTIRDTVTQTMPLQYGTTYQFDIMVVSSDNDKLTEYLKDNRVRAYLNLMVNNVKVISADGREESVQLVVVPNEESLRGYIQLLDRDYKKIRLEDGMVLSTINISEVQGFDVGDTITIQNMNLENAEVEVTEITMNYLGNVIYMTENTYKSIYDDYEPNSAYIMLNKGVTDHSAYADELGAKDGILSSISSKGVLESFDVVFKIINLVVVIVIVLAAALAFVVLFTLATTNISERERELATIKVLGFFDREVHSYVNKETMILTSMGILLGMPLGKAMGMWLMSILKMPAIYFADRLEPVSYLYAAVIATVFAFIVNSITDKSLDKINPVEALKSIE